MSKPYKFSFSYSRFALWKECPLHFKLKHIDKIDEPIGKAMLRGRKVHNEVADFVTGKSDWMPDALKKFTTLAQQIRDLPDAAKRIEEQMAFDRDGLPVTWFGANVHARYIWDVGVISKSEAGTAVHAVDWKTGKPRGSYDDQMQLFSIPAYLLYPDLIEFTGHLIYLDSGDDVEYPTIDRARFYGPACDPAANDGLFGLWKHNMAAMEADIAFHPKPSPDACQWCPHHQNKGGVCRVGA